MPRAELAGRTVAAAFAVGATVFALPAHASAPGGYRANLTACVMGRRGCDTGMLRDDDAAFLRDDRSARTRDPELARRIVEARTSKPIRIVVSEQRLDHLHRRDVEFERYRSTVRALRHGWVPGENAPYQQPPNAWAPSERNAFERDVARERSYYGNAY